MTLPARFTFRSAALTHASGRIVHTPLLDPGVAWVETPAEALAAAFGDAVRKNLLEQGRYRETLRHACPLELRPLEVVLEIPAAKDGHLYPAHEIPFQAFAAALPGRGHVGYVPALGIEAFAAKAEEIPRRLAEYLRLEFARRKRLGSARLLLEARWFPKTEIRESPVDAEFHTLSELRELSRGRLKKILPMAAEPLEAGRETISGLEEPLALVVRALGGKFARSVLLVGPPGVGKSALVGELARARGLPEALAARRIWATTAARLIQKLTGGSGWQENLDLLCRELRDEGAILYVRNLADLFEVGQYSGNETSMAEALRPYVERGDVLLLSECTEEEAARIDVRAPGYIAQMSTVRLAPPADAALPELVRRRVPAALPEAVAEILRLQRRYMPYSGFPGKTVRFLESLLHGRARISRGDVLAQFREETGMPAWIVDPDVPLPLDELDRKFRTSVYGQEEAVGIVLDLLAAVKAGLARPGKPIASLLFTGPTGVGKTELAKVLAETIFGDRSRILRFDMSEFQDPPAVSRLGGALLTGAVRQAPFSVVLLDELEKAHPLFFDLLLQVLGDGRLSDDRGRVVDFSSTIILMTSNLGASELPHDALGFGAGGDRAREIAAHFRRAAEEHFRPELFNRIDRLVAFRPLGRETIRRIVDREAERVRARPGLAGRPVELRIGPEALDALGGRGYDAAYGARQLQRAIRESLLVPLARQLTRYDARTAVEAELDAALVLRARGREAKAPPLTVFEGGISLNYAAGDILEQRRLLQSVAEGTPLAQLASEVEILERKRRKAGDVAFIKSGRAETLTRHRKLLETWRAVLEEVRELEMESTAALLDPSAKAPEDLLVRFEAVREEALGTMYGVYDAVHPSSRTAWLAIYGTGEALESLTELYRGAAKSLGLRTDPRWVWHLPRPGKFLTTPRPTAPSDPGALLCGVEMEASGTGASLAFVLEGGLHLWLGRDGTKSPCVLREEGGEAGEAGRKAFEAKRPENVHRKAFFENRETFRTWCVAKGEVVIRSKTDEPVGPEELARRVRHGMNRLLRGHMQS